jgi:hypothetical protein
VSNWLAPAWTKQRSIDASDPTSHDFYLPALLLETGLTLAQRAYTWQLRVARLNGELDESRREIDNLMLRLYGLADTDIDVPEGVDSQADSSSFEDEEEQPANGGPDARKLVSALVEYVLGCTFGRWDIRYAIGERAKPELPEPFEPLPFCPPGQLQNAEGMAITRDDAYKLEAQGLWRYPIEIPWDGVLIDDPGHPRDIEGRVQHVLEIILKDRWETVEREMCEILGVKRLREYFRKPGGFFRDQLERYSKSRRKAPIYWPLSTDNGAYTVWVYYPRLSAQTLYTCVNDYLDPKLGDIEKDQDRLGRLTTTDRKSLRSLDELRELQIELKSMRERLLKVAALPYKPNMNDGVLITAAPLWQFFRHGVWADALKECWKELNEGEYLWSHLAYAVWPDRVRKACVKDKSIAIAHELHELYEG